MGNKRIFPLWIAGAAYLADATIAAPCGTEFSTIEDNLQMQGIPVLAGEKLF